MNDYISLSAAAEKVGLDSPALLHAGARGDLDLCLLATNWKVEMGSAVTHLPDGQTHKSLSETWDVEWKTGLLAVRSTDLMRIERDGYAEVSWVEPYEDGKKKLDCRLEVVQRVKIVDLFVPTVALNAWRDSDALSGTTESSEELGERQEETLLAIIGMLAKLVADGDQALSRNQLGNYKEPHAERIAELVADHTGAPRGLSVSTVRQHLTKAGKALAKRAPDVKKPRKQ